MSKPKSGSYEIRTQLHLDNCQEHVATLPLGKGWSVKVESKRGNKRKSLSKNRFRLIAKIVGIDDSRDTAGWNRYLKNRLLREVLIKQDSNRFLEFFDKARTFFMESSDKEFAERVIGDSIKTEWLTPESFEAFIKAIEAWIDEKLGKPPKLKQSVVAVQQIGIAKNPPYRNKKMLAAAAECPHCMNCGKHKDGTIVPAHYQGFRQHELGKGTGVKPTDSAVAFVCLECHDMFDGRVKAEGGEIDKSEAFLFAIVKTSDYLLKNNILNT